MRYLRYDLPCQRNETYKVTRCYDAPLAADFGGRNVPRIYCQPWLLALFPGNSPFRVMNHDTYTYAYNRSYMAIPLTSGHSTMPLEDIYMIYATVSSKLHRLFHGALVSVHTIAGYQPWCFEMPRRLRSRRQGWLPAHQIEAWRAPIIHTKYSVPSRSLEL